jgi:phosphatidate cytidylyltransferase
MTRVLSALVLLPVVIGTIWFLPPGATMVLAAVAAVLAFVEYRAIAAALGVTVSAGIGGVAVALAVCAVWSTSPHVIELYGVGSLPITPHPPITLSPLLENEAVPLILMSAFVVMGAISVSRGRPAAGVLNDAAATMMAPIYLGLPLGALAAVRGYAGAMASHDRFPGDPDAGRVVLLLLLAVIVVSDSAQYYTGRAFGRRPLSPAISPKKTVEGAIGGVVFGTLAMTLGGFYVFDSPIWLLALLGAVIVMLGIVGDLFESLLKRSAGVKDSSNLIPGHGGVLDRIDSWLFAAPVYYVFVRWIA